MLDNQGRMVIPTELLKKVELTTLPKDVSICFDTKKKSLVLMEHPLEYGLCSCENVYYIATKYISEKGRINIPKTVRDAFENASYLPAEQDGKIYILIIEHEKKPE